MKNLWRGILISLLLCLFPVCVSASETEAAKSSEEPYEITGFVCQDPILENMYLTYEQKPAKEELTADMPAQMMVYLDGETKATAIDVTWFDITEDYETTGAYYYQFSPAWDTGKYVLSEELDLFTDVPYVAVFFYPEEMAVSTAAATTYTNETIVYKFLRDHMDLNTAAICGILANLQKESCFSPTEYYNDTGNTISYGLCQWNSGAGRYTQLKSWCTENGYDYTTLTGQMNFMKYELETTSYYRLSQLENNIENTADGAYDAAMTWAKYYEGCAKRYYTERANLAKNTYWPAYCHLINDVSEIFSDVSWISWYHDAVSYCYNGGLMTGTSDTTFEPESFLTRAQVVTVLYRGEGAPAVSYNGKFADVGKSTWYTSAVAWGSQCGIIEGYTETSFGPNDCITREQMVTMLYRYAAWKGCDTTGNADLLSFGDAARVNDFAQMPMKWAVAKGIIQGIEDETTHVSVLNPQGSANRAECATIIMRFRNIFYN